ncbi:hypothetical protein SELMODRAFT_448436 [Selaginella moellendorffii]|uniref:Bulb-type lectin domain-containing protein n=1 Tax=Selaginella moellendorffii TaxID=88036 RepID=D8T7A8_SELML|nr:EP1-like glycoprotein 2 [Selaginella moellendorffii]XP_024521017.1 EP1-like glycoprotein 2 [Selaginella moellendorffii]XP_024521018.1 EP1-like glycoprotein 2 [Selaginella moellendorffii]XP_024521019.1 EP1-like glycoprotein 2 [Selaginella moellendorffii]XP_024521021.1 EP1-like glycoprotein 2 [Selaginella moellendorffii]XP_024521022.1 EP1-like glycoprotein 2 [Selaginella moellendorffii]XP_024521023.1 EP1-like glycoprotein 2 [Selaginella moellendorffii]EFJ07394.1 hypothetical protein SELMODR|eukprot:XP_002991472.1 EP1-like glycoprotein 2 [Selaginella moellendorffii]
MVRFPPPAAAAAAAYLLFLFTTSSFVLGKRYELSPGWTAVNNESLKGAGSDGGSSYRILRAGEDPIVSDNGSFSLAFYDPQGTNRYFLCVLLNVGKSKPAPASLVVPIWIANSNSSFSGKATLMLTGTHKKFILLDSTGTLKWSSGSVVGISSLELDETGNLMLISEDGSVLWQSFEHPTNVLVPGQTLRPGMSITSVNSSSQQPGPFRGTMEASGFVFYVLPETEPTMADMLRKPQPYQVWSVGSSSSSLESALKVCDSSKAVMAVTSSGIVISYERSSSGECGGDGKSLQVYRNDEDTAAESQYWKLEENGDFVLRGFHEREQNWATVFALSTRANDSCKHPTACGSYGLCNSQGKCQCVGNEELDDHTSHSCGAPSGVSASCLANEAANHHFVKIPSATYFSNAFSRPDLRSSSLEDCSAACASNCSCAAAFFSRSGGGDCFLVDEVMGSLSLVGGGAGAEEGDYTALVKIQNAQLISAPLSASRGKGTSKSARTAIIFLAVLCGVLAVMLAAGGYIIKIKYPHAYNKMMRRS